MIPPTKRQMDVLRFVTGFQEAKGYSPSTTEIGAAVYGYRPGSRSGAVQGALVGLERRRFIRRLPKRARAIEVLRPPIIPRDPQGEPLYFVEVGK